MKSCRDGTAAFLTISLRHFVERRVYFPRVVKGGQGFEEGVFVTTRSLLGES
jgi:hypothetical protein